MTTYVWYGVLCDYWCGMAAVEAESAAEAHQKVRDDERLPDHVKEELLDVDPQEASGVEYVHGGG